MMFSLVPVSRWYSANWQSLAVSLLGACVTLTSFALACHIELGARHRIFIADAESYFDTIVLRMRDVGLSLQRGACHLADGGPGPLAAAPAPRGASDTGRTGAAALFAPPVRQQSGRPAASYGIAVFAVSATVAPALIFRRRPGWPQSDWWRDLCGGLCSGARLERSYQWAGRRWHVVLDGAPFSLDETPPGAIGLLLAGLLGTTAMLLLLTWRNGSARRIAELASLRTRELIDLNAILLDDIAARKQAADDLGRSQRELRALAAHNATVKEEERKRIAREIHDDLGQNMLALRIDLVLMEAGDPASVTREHLRQAIAQIDITMNSIRLIINALRPAVLDLGLEAAVEWESAKFRRRTGIDCIVNLPLVQLALPDEVATALYRIVQESLTNIMRHAQASLVTIELWSEQGWMFLRLADNGVGMAEECRRKGKCFGLIGIAERVYALGGAFDTDSAAGAGTRLTIALPSGAPGATGSPPSASAPAAPGAALVLPDAAGKSAAPGQPG